jgi:glyoxylase I family protein
VVHEEKWYSEVIKKEISEYGKFIWIKDPEGRLVELWEK